MLAKYKLRSNQFNASIGLLNAYNPLQTLHRGYAIVTSSDRNIITKANQVHKDDPITIQVHNGVINATVDSTETKKIK